MRTVIVDIVPEAYERYVVQVYVMLYILESVKNLSFGNTFENINFRTTFCGKRFLINLLVNC